MPFEIVHRHLHFPESHSELRSCHLHIPDSIKLKAAKFSLFDMRKDTRRVE